MRELVLTLHGLGEPHAGVDKEESQYWWSVSAFARLLDSIADRLPSTDPKISITFDDGNASDALLALPELAKRNLKASFFVCAGRIGTRHYLDKSMIVDLIEAGMHIGSHGMDHRDWCTLSASELGEEISGARRRLQDVSGTSIEIVAIPFGSYNRRVLMQLKHEPWTCIYTSDRGTTFSTAKMKARETLHANMQALDILPELVRESSMNMRVKRTIARVYKTWF
jgi:peptidoglycan/xylan/chitin deacetylase (PgdA/CDA1 family)